MPDKDLYLKIVKAIHPELKEGRLIIEDEFGMDLFYTKLQKIDVIEEVKLDSAKWDFAFNVILSFEQLEILTKDYTMFMAKKRSHSVGLPMFMVVQRDQVDLPISKVVQGMKEVFKANVLLLKHPDIWHRKRPIQLKLELEKEKINLVYLSDLGW